MKRVSKFVLGLALSLSVACTSGTLAGDPVGDDEQVVGDDAEQPASSPDNDKAVIIIERVCAELQDGCVESGYSAEECEQLAQLCAEVAAEATPTEESDISRRTCGTVCGRIEHECQEPYGGGRQGCEQVWCNCEKICDTISDERSRPTYCN